jgi:hypothetical protein
MLDQLFELIDKISKLFDQLPPGFLNKVVAVLDRIPWFFDQVYGARIMIDDILEFLRLINKVLEELLTWMEVAEWGSNVSLDLLLHGLFSGLAFSLITFLTFWVTRSVLGWLVFPQQSKISWQGVLEPYMWSLSLSLGFLSSRALHLWFDGFFF